MGPCTWVGPRDAITAPPPPNLWNGNQKFQNDCPRVAMKLAWPNVSSQWEQTLKEQPRQKTFGPSYLIWLYPLGERNRPPLWVLHVRELWSWFSLSSPLNFPPPPCPKSYHCGFHNTSSAASFVSFFVCFVCFSLSSTTSKDPSGVEYAPWNFLTLGAALCLCF